jgi:RNA polymerase sigma factor (sigma-70 family)
LTDRQLLDAFAERRDQGAFAALVARHGPMVLRVCRRVLGHEQDAEDAFQASFLVLAQKSGSIHKPDALADWLHGVAHRTAMSAKRSLARRRNHEAQSARNRRASSPSWDDVQAVLDEEIRCLSDSLRSSFVLCVLEGKSGPCAAQELGIKEGTLSSRLARARHQLRKRLLKRGIQLSTLLAALSVAETAAKAGVPASLARATVGSGILVAAGRLLPGSIPSHVAALAAEVTRAISFVRAKIALCILCTGGVLCGAGVLTRSIIARESEHLPTASTSSNILVQKERTNKKPKDPAAVRSFVGRVLTPDGQPVNGAKLYVTPAMGYLRKPHNALHGATSGADGRFEITVAEAELRSNTAVVTADALGYGPAWAQVSPAAQQNGVTLQLVKDDVPIAGTVIDLEGKPVSGATLRVQQINAAPTGNLDAWLAAAVNKKGLSLELEQQYLSRYTIALSPAATTDRDGRFQLTGIGADRLVIAQVDGPTIVSQPIRILTRPMATVQLLEHKGDTEYGEQSTVTTYYGSTFRYAAAPTRPIVGIVRDKDTQKPLAGVTIQSFMVATKPRWIVDNVQTSTDAEGRYRLTGMPRGKGNQIVAIPRDDQPYVVERAEVPDTPGLAPVTANVELRRGVWIEGRVTDKVTAQPVPASLEYFSLAANENLRDYPGFDGAIVYRWFRTKPDGSYRAVGLPGPGMLGVYADEYLRAPERNDEFAAKEASFATAPYHLLFPVNYVAIASVNSNKGADSVKQDITLDPGWRFSGALLGPDGKALAGARGYGLTGMHWWEPGEIKDGNFEVLSFNPRRPRDILFVHARKNLVGVARPPQKYGASVVVRMAPGAAVEGRLVGAEGHPRVGVALTLSFQPKHETHWNSYPSDEPITTDAQGRFHIAALLPGYAFRLSDGKGELNVGSGLQSGETKSLGDVEIKHKTD